MSKVTQIYSSENPRYLDDHIPIWRYVPLRGLFCYLNSLVFIPSVAKLHKDDPFEGKFYEEIPWFNAAFREQFKGSSQKVQDWIHKELCSDAERETIAVNRDYPDADSHIYQRHYFNFLRQTRFAWCWFQSSLESSAMWHTYGNQGVAIQSTVGRIAKTLGQTQSDFVFGQMRYVNYRAGVSLEFQPERPDDFALLMRPYFLKRYEYESEKEIRFVTAGPKIERGGILLRNINPADWITAIRLWPKLSAAEENSLAGAIQKFLPEVTCEKSDLLSGSGSMDEAFERLELMMEETEQRKWTDQTDSIPTELKHV